MIYLRSTYTGSPKKKVAIRVIIVIAALLAVSAATIAFGNHLKNKAEETTVYGIGAGRGDTDDSAPVHGQPGETTSVRGVRSACIALSALTSADKAKEQVDLLATKGFTGVTVVLVDRDGYLSYTSEAVSKYTKQRAADIKDPAIVSAITAQAKACSLRSSAVIFSSADFTSNDISAKIDEVVAVLPLDAASLDSILAASAVKYITSLDEAKGSAALGAALPLDVFSTPSLSPQVELFASVCDFLAIDLSKKSASAEEAQKAVTDVLDSISGYFTMYDLRAVFDGSEQNIADAQAKTLFDGGFANYMFVRATDFVEPDPTDDTDDRDDDDGGGTRDTGTSNDRGDSGNGGNTNPGTYDHDTGHVDEPAVSEPTVTEPVDEPTVTDPVDEPVDEPVIPAIPDIPGGDEDPGGADAGD